MQPWHSQDRHVVRLDWGPTGAESLTAYAAAAGSPVCAVVVDVLSFTTCVSVAVDAGTTVHPYRWKDDSARAFADERGATLAVAALRGRAPTAGSACPRRRSGPPDPSGTSCCPRRTGRRSAPCLRAPGPRSSRRRCATAPPSPRGSSPGSTRHGGHGQPAARDRRGPGGRAVAGRVLAARRRGPLGRRRRGRRPRRPARAPGRAAAAQPGGRGGRRGLARRRGPASARRSQACASGRELVEQGWPDDVAVARRGRHVAVGARARGRRLHGDTAR